MFQALSSMFGNEGGRRNNGSLKIIIENNALKG